jgi:hypothetical protein
MSVHEPAVRLSAIRHLMSQPRVSAALLLGLFRMSLFRPPKQYPVRIGVTTLPVQNLSDPKIYNLSNHVYSKRGYEMSHLCGNSECSNRMCVVIDDGRDAGLTSTP